MKLIIVFITGTVIFAVLKITGIILNKISLRYSFWKKINKVYPVLGIIIWIVFVFWLTGFLFKDRIYYPYIVAGMVLVIMGLITWFFLRDVFTGVLFKVQNDLNPGDYIKSGSISGQIKSLHLTHLEITSDSGQIIKIPNSKLNQDLISGRAAPEGMEKFKIRLLFDKRFTKPETEEKIQYEVANSPWCNFKHPPVIKLMDEDESTYTYDVHINTLNHKHLRLAERALKEKLEKTR